MSLEGVTTNHAAFGAKIAVTVGPENAKRTIYRTVGYGSSFGGNPVRQHIGIGPVIVVDKIEVAWPTSHMVQSFTHVAADHSYHLREGDKALNVSASPLASTPTAAAKH